MAEKMLLGEAISGEVFKSMWTLCCRSIAHCRYVSSFHLHVLLDLPVVSR